MSKISDDELGSILNPSAKTQEIKFTNVPTTPFAYWSWYIFIKKWMFTYPAIALLLFLIGYGLTGELGGTMMWLGKAILAILLFLLSAIWLILFPGGLIFLFIAPSIVYAILYFKKSKKISLNEEGGPARYVFNIIETAEGYYITRWRSEGIAGALKTILKGAIVVQLDELALRYIKDEGELKIHKEDFEAKELLEISIVPLTWAKEELLLQDHVTGSYYLNSRLLISRELRDEYRMMKISLAPSQKSELQNQLYTSAIQINDLEQERLQLKRALRDYPIMNIEKVGEVLAPEGSEEFLKHRGVHLSTDPKVESVEQMIEDATLAIKEKLYQQQEDIQYVED